VLDNLLAAVVYLGVGIALLVLAAFVVDLLTPGRLVAHVVEERSYSAAVVLAAALVGQGLVIFTAIWTNATTGFGDALLWTVVFGLLGVALTGVAFALVDLLTPGKLGEILSRPGPVQPVALVTAAAHLSVAGIVVASIA
jgi:uncharacterized membrane protein YjfL (UPF0719 family)